jgi:hypothetical protein
MADLYQPDGRVKEISPANGVHWTTEELRRLVGGYHEILETVDGGFMVVNEAYKVLDLELNIPATRLYLHGRKEVIQGNALVVNTRLEFGDEGLQ